MSLKQKHALITGSSRGIGRGIALKLAGAGATIAIHHYQNEAAAKETLRRIKERGADGQTTTPTLIDNRATGHQGYPDIAADGGMLHALWWDTRNDPCYSATRPVGNCADRSTVPALDIYATSSNEDGASWAASTKVTDVMSNGNYEQFDNRSVPFGGDYLWITARGSFAYGTWTDWRNTVQGSDPREVTEDEDNATADVKQCRTFNATTGTWSGDQCPHDGGIDQDIYGAVMP